MTRRSERTWLVLLLGGPSGAGKTAVGCRLARHFSVGFAEVDDFQCLLERMTTPEQLPQLHVWRTNPTFEQLTAEEIAMHVQAASEAMSPGLDAVIGNHLETKMPVVLEGDFIHPALAAQTSFSGQANGGRVRSTFLYEPDEEQYVRNFLLREPERGGQSKRARVSRLHGQWLKQEAERLGLPVVAARPWDTVLERIVSAIS